MKSILARPTRARRGFALLTVLAVMVATVALAVALSAMSNDAVAAARNRANYARARWLAEGCVEQARAIVGDALQEDRGGRAWSGLDSTLSATSLGTFCDVTVVPSGLRLDANAATY